MNEVYGYLFDGPSVGKTSFSVFIAILYMELLYVLAMTLMSLIDPITWEKPWILSQKTDKNPICISNPVLKDFGRQDVMVLDYLYQSYKKKLNGVILNEEEDFNPQLQVISFLGALYNNLKNKCLVLVLCPDDLVVKWHYYASKFGQFEVKIINPKTVPEEFDQEAGIVLLLSFTNIRLGDYLKEYDFFSVVIDRFDQVANKLVVRKLQGQFNIGITSRNFYIEPDQKLQWSMLNWACPGCVGKLGDFYEIDNDNFANSRDNYKEWWFRLTWSFCETFTKPTLEEKGNLINTLRNWEKTHNLEIIGTNKNNKRKRPQTKTETSEAEEEAKNNRQTKQVKKTVFSRNTKSTTKIPYKTFQTTKTKQNDSDLFSSNSSDSSDTVVYEADLHKNFTDEDPGLADDDEPPIGRQTQNKTFLEQNEVGSDKPLPPIEQNEDSMQKNIEEQDISSNPEQLLFSLARPKSNNSLKRCPNNEITESFDESDLFLRSVATGNSDFSQLTRKKSKDFFDKILEKPHENLELNAVSQAMELTENEVHDVPSKSDRFFKGIFNKKGKKKVDSGEKELDDDDCIESKNVGSSSAQVDVDTLVAEVMEMVGRK